MLRWMIGTAALLTSCTSIPDELEIVAWHIQIRPRMQIEDVYKLLYQSANGIGHFLTDTSAVRSYLQYEIAHLAPHDGEALVEPLRSDCTLVRVNLRPYLAGGGSAESLFRSMLITERTFKPDPDEFVRLWTQFVRHAGAFGFSTATADAFDRRMKADGYPAVHHSMAYSESYHPAYRVLTREALRTLTH